MFSFFRRRTPEEEFQRQAEQKLERADGLSRMILIIELVNQADSKRFYTAQINLIEKYTDWQNDPLMGSSREVALLMRDGERRPQSSVSEPSTKPEKVVVACPQCSQRLSVPSGKRLSVTCPRCRANFSYGP